jgi:hypothetical protein
MSYDQTAALSANLVSYPRAERYQVAIYESDPIIALLARATAR